MLPTPSTCTMLGVPEGTYSRRSARVAKKQHHCNRQINSTELDLYESESAARSEYLCM
jgi:hypothetical protein